MTKPKGQRGRPVHLAFRHLDLICHLNFDIWISYLRIPPKVPGEVRDSLISDDW